MQYREVEQISKASPSPDWSLQLDSMKLESLVIPNQNVGVNTFPGVVHRVLYTPPVTPWESVIPEGGSLTSNGGGQLR